MSPNQIDALCLIMAAVLPVIAVWKMKRAWLGLAIGAFCNWGMLVFAGMILHAMDSQRDATMLDTIWLLFGWIASLVYAGMLAAIKIGIQQRLERKNEQPPFGTPPDAAGGDPADR